jgi:hypothetical protein
MNWMELAPNPRPMPTIVVVAVEAAEMHYDSLKTSEISFWRSVQCASLVSQALVDGHFRKNEWLLDGWTAHPLVARLRHAAARWIGRSAGDVSEHSSAWRSSL